MPAAMTLDQWIAKAKRRQVEYMPAAIRGMKIGAERAVAELQRQTRIALPANPDGKGSGGAVDTGRLLRSWRVWPMLNGVRVGNDAPYSGVVEEGRRKNRKAPPRRVIVAWLMRRRGLNEREAQRASWPVARAIGRRGLIARKIMGRVQPKLWKMVEAGAIEGIRRVLR